MKRKIFATLLSVAAIFCCAFAMTACLKFGSGSDRAESIVYTLNSDGVSYSCAGTGDAKAKNVVIAAKHNGKPVTAIKANAFAECTTIKSVVIPDSVTSIGGSAFKGCISLESITFSAGLISIENFAFRDCSSLKNIVIPNTVTQISHGLFKGCTGLESITIPFVGNQKNAHHLGYIFADGDVNNNKNSNIPQSLKTVAVSGGSSIGNSAFEDCGSITGIVIADSVTSIGYNAFNNCAGLQKIYYKGTAQEWNAISIDSANSALTTATLYYYSESNPFVGGVENGNFWHYVEGEIVVWSK